MQRARLARSDLLGGLVVGDFAFLCGTRSVVGVGLVRKQETAGQQVLQKSNAQNLQAPVDFIVTLVTETEQSTTLHSLLCAQRSCPDFAVLTNEGEDADAGDDGKEKDDEDDGSRGAAN